MLHQKIICVDDHDMVHAFNMLGGKQPDNFT